ncbi:MAG: hypothetical protein KJ576_12830 [Proteobacteria bacterium]|nr:hypothetical protein [Pseudomonadota bacterium]MBV1718125.1 hypothetical protein [Desulfarculus sp.]
MKKILLALLLALCLAQPAWAGFREGMSAYKRGDYADALKEFEPLAEQGDALAQFYLGFMYAQGQGVPQNRKQAVKWLSNRERRSQAPLFISSFLTKPVGIMVVFEVETPARLTIGLEALAHLCTLRVSS